MLKTAVTLVVVLGLLWMADDLGQQIDHERDLRRHACHELELAGADADSAADVEACTFDRSR